VANPNRRGQSAGPVSGSVRGDDETPFANTSFLNPYGLTLRQTITSSGSVTIPSGITWVYAIMTSGGGGSFFGYSGNGGEVTWGWTLAQNTCIVGAGGTDGNAGGYTRYGHLIATGAGTRGGQTRPANYYGQPAGISYGDSSFTANGGIGANAGNGSNANAGFQGGDGGNGISGGSGGGGNMSTGTSLGGLGGSGLTGGGGGRAQGTTTGTRTGGNGGNGINILTGAVTTGGAGATGTGTNGAGGGGAGIAGNGGNGGGGNSGGTGGLGGGGAGGTGTGGAGILYIFY
jgi:hypothetical protein